MLLVIHFLETLLVSGASATASTTDNNHGRCLDISRLESRRRRRLFCHRLAVAAEQLS